MAVKFHLPDGTETDLVTHSYNGFPTKSADEQRQFFIAVGSSGPGTPSPTPLEKFFTTHPAAKTFLTTQDPPPVSYGTTVYFGVNSFKFTNAAGHATFGRYQLVPEAGRQYLSKAEAAKAMPEYLTQEIGQRVAHGPVRFKLVLQVAAAGDKIDDPSVAWSDNNERIGLGTLAVTALVPDSESTDRGPAVPTRGVAGWHRVSRSDDSVFATRRTRFRTSGAKTPDRHPNAGFQALEALVHMLFSADTR